MFGTPEGAVGSAGDFQREQLWVLGTTSEPAVGDGDGLPPRRHLSGGAETPNGGTRCAEDPQWSNWEVLGIPQGGIGNSRNSFLPSLREQQWILGTLLPVR